MVVVLRMRMRMRNRRFASSWDVQEVRQMEAF